MKEVLSITNKYGIETTLKINPADNGPIKYANWLDVAKTELTLTKRSLDAIIGTKALRAGGKNVLKLALMKAKNPIINMFL